MFHDSHRGINRMPGLRDRLPVGAFQEMKRFSVGADYENITISCKCENDAIADFRAPPFFASSNVCCDDITVVSAEHRKVVSFIVNDRWCRSLNLELPL